jgi:hypothetical protein
VSQERTVWVVTHGQKEIGVNPDMTPHGYEEVAALRMHLPNKAGEVITGTGKRHLRIPKILGYSITRVTPCVGGPESLEKIGPYIDHLRKDIVAHSRQGSENTMRLNMIARLGEFKAAGLDAVVVLADGTFVDRKYYTGPEDGPNSICRVIGTAKHDSIICAGRPAMVMLGMTDTSAKSAAVYKLTVRGEAIAKIVEVTTTGEVEIGAV